MKKHQNQHIPPHVKGKKVDIEREQKFSDKQQALNAFRAAREKLLDINRWHHTAGCNSSRFVLQDAKGKLINRAPTLGDYVKIDIPGPGPIYGAGFDWVMVSQCEDLPDEAYVMLRLQPSPPLPNSGKRKVAHFFKSYASTTLIVQVAGNSLQVCYYGRNEIINTDSDHLLDNMRNYAVGLGAKIGLSYPQWEKLVTGILSRRQD